MTRNIRPAPKCIAVSEKILPPDILFKLFVLAWATCGCFVLAPSAIAVSDATTLSAGIKSFFQVDWDPLKIFLKVFLNPPPSIWNWLGVKVICS